MEGANGREGEREGEEERRKRDLLQLFVRSGIGLRNNTRIKADAAAAAGEEEERG